MLKLKVNTIVEFIKIVSVSDIANCCIAFKANIMVVQFINHLAKIFGCSCGIGVVM